LARHLFPETFRDLRNGEELHLRAEAGDLQAIETIQRSGETLGYALALVVDLLAPERIILGSMARRLGARFIESLLAAVQKEALPASFARCKIVPGELGESIGDVAAICVAMQAMEEEHRAA
jgi:glucokinase